MIVCLLSLDAKAEGTVSAPLSLSGSDKLSIGAELGATTTLGSQVVGDSQGAGVLGSYKLDPNWSVQGDMFFSSRTNNYRFYSWYGPYNQQLNSNSVTLTLGPVYRPTSRRFSPLIGFLGSYEHDYYSLQNYCYERLAYSQDSLFVGPMVGLEYRITRDVTIGAELRYMMNVVTSNNLPAPYNTTNGSLNYYMAGINVKFNF